MNHEWRGNDSGTEYPGQQVFAALAVTLEELDLSCEDRAGAD